MKKNKEPDMRRGLPLWYCMLSAFFLVLFLFVGVFVLGEFDIKGRLNILIMICLGFVFGLIERFHIRRFL